MHTFLRFPLVVFTETILVMKLMRHKSIQTTLTYYANVNAHKIGEKLTEAWSKNQVAKDRAEVSDVFSDTRRQRAKNE